MEDVKDEGDIDVDNGDMEDNNVVPENECLAKMLSRCILTY